MDYEKKIARLDEINTLLKNSETPLSEAMKLFEEAAGITKDCQEYLNTCAGTITKIKLEMGKILEEKMNV